MECKCSSKAKDKEPIVDPREAKKKGEPLRKICIRSPGKGGEGK